MAKVTMDAMVALDLIRGLSFGRGYSYSFGDFAGDHAAA